jgi:hypothetical protein
MLHLRRVSAMGSSPTGWRTATLGVTCSSVLGCNVSKPIDWKGRSNTMATTFTGLYPSGLFFGGTLKTEYSTPVPDTDALKAWLRDALAAVTEEMLEKTWTEVEYRLNILSTTNGAHIEVYLYNTKNFLS